MSRDRIAFSVNVRVGHDLRAARIAPMAWTGVVRSLAPFEIIDVSVLPLSANSRAARSDTDVHTAKLEDGFGDYGLGAVATQDPPPQYSGGPNYDLRETDKSPNYTLRVPTPASPPMKRSSSALGWFSRNR